MKIEIHPMTKMLSGAILLAVGVLIIPSPLVPSALADPPLDCGEFDPGQCIEECCDEYDDCVGFVQSLYNSCINGCQTEPEPEDCEIQCEEAKEINLEICNGEAEFCIFLCGV